ncbi:hypothetical protein NXS19_010623 [Fusarium pseudograminearum]|nr:hypothetical protein NXS19_010623 [Fusarium pseudograminearum]
MPQRDRFLCAKEEASAGPLGNLKAKHLVQEPTVSQLFNFFHQISHIMPSSRAPAGSLQEAQSNRQFWNNRVLTTPRSTDSAIVDEIKRIIKTSEITKEDDSKWPQKNKDGHQEFLRKRWRDLSRRLEVTKEDDSKWLQKNKDGRQEFGRKCHMSK